MCNNFKLEHANVPPMRPLASNAGDEDSTLEMQSSKRHTASVRQHHRDMLVAANGHPTVNGHPTATRQQPTSQCLPVRKRKKPSVELEAASIRSQKVLKVNADDQRQRHGESYEHCSGPGPPGKKRSRRKATQESMGSTAEPQQAQLGRATAAGGGRDRGRGIGEVRGGGRGGGGGGGWGSGARRAAAAEGLANGRPDVPGMGTAMSMGIPKFDDVPLPVPLVVPSFDEYLQLEMASTGAGASAFIIGGPTATAKATKATCSVVSAPAQAQAPPPLLPPPLPPPLLLPPVPLPLRPERTREVSLEDRLMISANEFSEQTGIPLADLNIKASATWKPTTASEPGEREAESEDHRGRPGPAYLP